MIKFLKFDPTVKFNQFNFNLCVYIKQLKKHNMYDFYFKK